jgi:hypothetical protein
MSKLGFRSSKLAYRSNKLVVSTPFQACDVSASFLATGIASATGNTGNVRTGWAYPTESVFGSALAALNGGSWYASAECKAGIVTDHSHGCAVVGHTHRNQYNQVFLAAGERVFLKPSGVSTVSESYVRLYNAGRVLHTTRAGPSGTNHVVALAAHAGSVPLYIAGGTLDEGTVFLTLYFYANAATFYQIDLSLATLRILNGANGVIDAGLGRNTYMMNGYIDLVLPAQVNTILSAYTGISLNLGWNWGASYLCGYCVKCLDDYLYTGYESTLSACSVLCTSTHLAQAPQLFVR